MSGLWINNQQRYRSLLASDRLTLTGAFQRGGLADGRRHAGASPEPGRRAVLRLRPRLRLRATSATGARVQLGHDARPVHAVGFQRAERDGRTADPLMAEITLVSSHTPWAPIPQLIDWDDVGDGSVFADASRPGQPADDVWQDPARVRAEYRQSIEYSLNSLISYVEKYGDDNLVLVFLGDHQPAPVVTGESASRDVPITIVARDPAVLDRIAGWGWQDGLKPGPQAPVWRMDRFPRPVPDRLRAAEPRGQVIDRR